jgi:hypothetical protein|tara:strand:+ start:624 stop:758 length:135 start_codon:yes stop_codon:yes gene_type:complete
MIHHAGLTLLWGSLATISRRDEKETDAKKKKGQAPKDDKRFDVM